MELREFWKNDIARNGLRLVYSTGCPEPYPAQINITASLILSVVFSLGSAFVANSVQEWIETNKMTETYRGPIQYRGVIFEEYRSQSHGKDRISPPEPMRF